MPYIDKDQVSTSSQFVISDVEYSNFESDASKHQRKGNQIIIINGILCKNIKRNQNNFFFPNYSTKHTKHIISFMEEKFILGV